MHVACSLTHLITHANAHTHTHTHRRELKREKAEDYILLCAQAHKMIVPIGLKRI